MNPQRTHWGIICLFAVSFQYAPQFVGEFIGEYPFRIETSIAINRSGVAPASACENRELTLVG